MDIVSKAIMMMPNIIFLDVMVQGDIAASEIVNSLRCYDRLKHAAIVTFAYISAHEAANVRDIGEIMKSRAAACDKAGATRFLGLYTESEFQDCLQELGVAG
jgi:exonuclease VII large subunit